MKSRKEWEAEFTAMIQARLGRPSDVFWATRYYKATPNAKEELLPAYWYRVWEDESRQRWVHFGLLGSEEWVVYNAIEALEIKDKAT